MFKGENYRYVVLKKVVLYPQKMASLILSRYQWILMYNLAIEETFWRMV
jgi:hypothetical protein